jgi:hypothetical protein
MERAGTRGISAFAPLEATPLETKATGDSTVSEED